MSFIGTRLHFRTRSNILSNPPSSSSSSSHLHSLLPYRTFKMSMTQSKSKRPICSSCSKPARTCLCSRIRVSGIENSVHVTILQHALEVKHPLNSTIIAKMGFKNLTVATVSDVNFGARFMIRLIDPTCGPSSVRSVGNDLFCGRSWETGETQKLFCEEECNLIDGGAGKRGLGNGVCDNGGVVSGEVEKNPNNSNIDPNCGDCEESGVPAITFSIRKYGAISSLSHIWMQQFQSNKKLSFDYVLAHHEACEALSKGFLVKKLQSRQSDNGIDLEEFEEFDLEVPSGSVLLFPSDNAVSINQLEAIGFKVKNLIVLDGTWAKARRVYSENPWLNILPHLKLEVNEMSLYNEVRHQPKPGYLSTIESIVHALKAFGENHESLDYLLDTFESMVGDQRRCKDERLSKLLPNS